MKRTVIIAFSLLICIMPIYAQITGRVSIKESDLSFSERNDYDIIRLNGQNGTTTQAGAPELPVIIRTFVIPQNTKVEGLDATVTQRAQE